MRSHRWLVCGLGLLAIATSLLHAADSPEKSPGVAAPSAAIVRSEFIFDRAPFAACHASTIAQTSTGFVAAWFGGTREGATDVGIWMARHDGQAWSAPVEVANGQDGDKRFPAWNPVLFQVKDGPLLLFYKIGIKPAAWTGMLMTSDDGGVHWSSPRRLPDDILGPIKDKPIMLSNGTLLCPSSNERDGWRLYMERTTDSGKAWSRLGPLNDGKSFGLIQPTVLDHGHDRLQALCRSKQGKIVELWSEDAGRSWGEPKATELPNPNSGIDAVALKDGRFLLIYNHAPKGRSPLNLAISKDGHSWKQIATLEDENGEYSYPAIIQANDGMVHATWTWKRLKIRHIVIDPSKLDG